MCNDGNGARQSVVFTVQLLWGYDGDFASDSFPTIRHCAPYKSVLLFIILERPHSVFNRKKNFGSGPTFDGFSA